MTDALEHDSRDVITPNNFRVAPHLYGLPLATPWRRLFAAGVDGVLLAVLIGGGFTALGLLGVLLVIGAARRHRRDGPSAATARVSAGSLFAVFALVGGLALWNAVMSDADVDVTGDDDRTHGVELPPAQAMAFGVAIAQLKTCDDPECRGRAVDAMTRALVGGKGNLRQGREAVDEVIEGMALPAAETAALEQRAAQAMTPGDSAPPAATPPGTGSEPPRARHRDRTRELMRDGGFSLLATLRNLGDDLGISAGWAALYFTLFTWIWNGQTPGKRLCGLRVIHLRGRPLTWWDAFERFGGYAAGVATGLIGYLQVFWDANRQALHDRVSFTAVIRDADGKALQRALETAVPPPPTTP